MKGINQKISRLIALSLLDKLDAGQKKELEAWLSQSEANRYFYKKVCTEQDLARRQQLRKKIDVGAAIRKFDNRTTVYNNHRKFQYKIWVRIAAVLVLIVGTFFLYRQQHPEAVKKMAQVDIRPGSTKAVLVLANGRKMCLENRDTLALELSQGIHLSGRGKKLVYQSTEQQVLPQYNELRVPRGGEYKIVLSDGTFVHLNSETVLRYPIAFGGKKREVVLSGEAYFEVAEDSLHPFLVKCKGYEVKVLGTVFNISAYDDDDVSLATLVKGHVRIRHRDGETDLLAGQMATVSAQGVSVAQVEAENAISWTKDFFSFQEETLEQIFKKMSRWYDVGFIYESSDVRTYRFSGSIPRYEGIHSVLQIMEQAAALRFVQEGRQIKIYKIFQ